MLRNLRTVAITTNRQLSTAPRVLVTGACGQIGSELVGVLRERYGASNVIASDIRVPQSTLLSNGPFVYGDVQDFDLLSRVVVENRIDWVVHFAAMLSAVGERNPQAAMKLNARGIENVLELARIVCPLFANLRAIHSSRSCSTSSVCFLHQPSLLLVRPLPVWQLLI